MGFWFAREEGGRGSPLDVVFSDVVLKAPVRFDGSILADTFWYLVARALPGVSQIALVFIVTQLTGAQGYAVFGFCMSIAVTISAATAGWLNQGCYKYLPLRSYRCPELIGAVRFSVWWTLGTAAVMYLIVAAASSVGESSVSLLFSGVALAVSVSGYSALLGVLQGQGRAKQVALVESGRAGLTILLLLALFVAQLNSVFLALSAYASAYAAFLLVLWLSVLGPRSISTSVRALRRRRVFVRRLLRFGIPMSAWVFTFTLLPFSDRFLIQLSVDSAEAGRYMVAYDLVVRSSALLLLPVTIAVHPHVMRAISERRAADAKSLLLRGVFLQILACVAFCLVIAIWGPRVLTSVAGGTESTSSLLVLLAVGGCLWQVAMFAHKVLEGTGQTTWILASMTVALLASVCWNLLMLPANGPVAAAYALCISALVYIGLTSTRSYFVLRSIAQSSNESRKRVDRR